jgi:drug/metabolite transporter (DMT)-like permease
LKRFRWQLALLGVTVIWGATFVIVQDAVEQVAPFLFIALRFWIAAAALILLGGLRLVTRKDFMIGVPTGVLLFGGYALQTVGLQYTTASNAGFITGMFVVFTPLLVAVTTRSLPSRAALVGVASAFAGLYLIAAPSSLRIGYGDALVVGCAAAFAAHILAQHRFRARIPTLRFAAIQMITVAAISSVWTLVGERGTINNFDGSVVSSLLITGLAASALAFFIQARAQREVPPTRTAIILTSEPVFAGLFGAWAGEQIGVRGWTGAGFILAGILIAELRTPVSDQISEPLATPT